MNRKKKVCTFLLIVLYLSYTCIYVARVNLSISAPELMQQGVLDSAQIGILGSVFFTVYAVGRIINGKWSDTTAPWKVITTGLFLTGISNLFMSRFDSYTAMILCWMLNAYGQSMLWSSILCVITSLYGKSDAKRKSSVMVSSVAVGNIVGIVLNTYFIAEFGVRYAFVIPGITAIVFSAVSCRMLKPVAHAAVAEEKKTSFVTLLKDRELVLVNITAIIHGVMKENIGLWMAVYIADTYYVDLTTSSYYILLIPTIGFIGRAIYPVLFKMCREDEQKLSFISFLICAIGAVYLCVGKREILCSVVVLGIIYMVISIINTSMLSIYPLKYTEQGTVASVSGCMDFSTYLGAGVSSTIYGVVIKKFGYGPMFISWAVISVISLFIIYWLKKEDKNE